MPLSQQLLEGAETANAFESLISVRPFTTGKHTVQHTTSTDVS